MAIKVLIVDDSALMRALLTEIINGAPDLEVVGAAPDPIAAREMIIPRPADAPAADAGDHDFLVYGSGFRGDAEGA